MTVELVHDDGWAPPAVEDTTTATSWDAEPDRLLMLDAPVVMDPIDRVVADLAVVDQAMARILRAMGEAGPRDGLSVRRVVGWW